ncbi:TonB family protein [Wenzhouxiangella sp. EGI_FJ10305]|uniref:TonB family protein n=1 Tax=Wenzhouxiangella sp. EGI_FJ10305 TaxID=3243768 RepID=UPI0035DFC949
MTWLNAPVVEQIGLSLLHFLWQGALIGLLYAATLPATRGATARTRYIIAVLTLAALAAAPGLTLALLLQSANMGATTASVATDTASTILGLQAAAGGTDVGGISVMHWVVAAWLAGVLLLSARLALGWHFLRRLRRTADFSAASSLQPQLRTLVRRLGISRPVALAVSARIQSPVVIGWLKPLVLLPPAILTGLPTRQLEMVLAHELAHVRRLDHLVNLCQTVTETVLFYHPVVRWVSHRIRIERENACDDLAVAVTDNRLAYVEMLASLEQLRYRGPKLALAMHDGQMLSRIRRLVERGRPDRQQGLTGPALLSGLILAAAASLHWLDEEPGPPEPEPVIETIPEPRPDPAYEPLDEIAEVVDPAPVDPAPDPDNTAAPAEASTADSAEPTTSPDSDDNAQQAAAEATDNESQPPVTPALETDRLPPVSELIERSSDRQVAMIEAPALTKPELPQPTPRPSQPTETELVTGGDLVERIEPDYPDSARKRGINGSVEVEFMVTRNGEVRDIEIVDETPRGLAFAEAAREAIIDWRFEPFRRGDEPIQRRVRLEMAFDLGQRQQQECRSVLGSRIPRCY